MSLLTIDFVRDLLKRVCNNRDYGWSLVSSYAHILINIVVQVALIPLYLKYLGKSQFGMLMIILASINYLGMGISWASAGVQRIMGELYAKDDLEELRKVFGLGRAVFFMYAVVTTGTGVALFWFMGDTWFDMSPSVREDVLQVLGLSVVYMVVLYDLNVDRLVMISTGRQAAAHALMTLSLVVFAIFVPVVLFRGGGLPEIMAVNLLGVFVARVVSFIGLRRFGMRADCPGAGSWRILRRLLGPMGRGYALYGALLLTLLQADTILLGALGGAHMVADYVLIWKVADVTMQALWRLPENLVPYLVHMDARSEKKRMHSIYLMARKVMFSLSALVAVGYGALGAVLVELWVGPENAPDEPWAYALAGGALFWMVIARLPAVYAYSMVRLRSLVIVTSFETFGKLLLIIAMFPFMGLYAPLVAVNVVHALGCSIMYQRLVVTSEFQD